MQESFVTINNVATHVMCWGHSIEEKFGNEIQEIVIVIPGNPGEDRIQLLFVTLVNTIPYSGLPGFYTSFCSTLFNELEKEVPVLVIGKPLIIFTLIINILSISFCRSRWSRRA
jgi:hypothetical protein